MSTPTKPFPPGARVLIDDRDEAIVRQHLFPYYKVDFVDGDKNVAVRADRVGTAEKAPPCFICGDARPWANGSWQHRHDPEPVETDLRVASARCDGCWEVESRLVRYLRAAAARENVRMLLADADAKAAENRP